MRRGIALEGIQPSAGGRVVVARGRGEGVKFYEWEIGEGDTYTGGASTFVGRFYRLGFGGLTTKPTKGKKKVNLGEVFAV